MAIMSMFSEYNVFKYIYPPRPESAIPPDELDKVGDGYIAQPKYNGSCGVLFLKGRTNFHLYNRHNEPLTKQVPIPYSELNDSDKYMVLCGEYLNKNKLGENDQQFNHKFIIWDILVWQGRYLIGETFESRLMLLSSLYGTSQSVVTKDSIVMYEHLQTTRVENVYVSPSYVNNFKSLYDRIVKTDLYEGIVIKKASAKLELGFKKKNNYTWQFKARKETKNYVF
jgi:ATP-dependent DNA ligase